MFLALLLIGGPAMAGQATLTTLDGVALHATDWGEGEHGVLLVHAEGRSRRDWAILGPRLAANGFHALAVDLRRHGDASLPPAGEPDRSARLADVGAGIAWLRTHGATSVHVVGASLGASLSLEAASADLAVDDVVMLSPPPNATSPSVSAALSAYGRRPLLIAASRQDVLSARTAASLSAHALGHHRLELYDNAGTGVRMLHGAPELESVLLAWLRGGYQAPAPTAVRAAVSVGAGSPLPTTGRRLEDRKR